MRMLANPSIPRRACLAALAAVLCPRPAAGAGEFSLTLDGGWHDLTNASNSAKAVFDGASGGPTFGLAVQYGLGESFFIRAGARYFQRDGERVFVAAPESPVFRLGHPLDGADHSRLRRWSASASCRARSLRPYIGVGGGVTSYNEESDVAGEIFTSTATKASGHAVAGLDYGRGTVRFGGEVMYSLVPNTIGFGGVSRGLRRGRHRRPERGRPHQLRALAHRPEAKGAAYSTIPRTPSRPPGRSASAMNEPSFTGNGARMPRAWAGTKPNRG